MKIPTAGRRRCTIGAVEFILESWNTSNILFLFYMLIMHMYFIRHVFRKSCNNIIEINFVYK